jgi:two-component sensor histidine kinase
MPASPDRFLYDAMRAGLVLGWLSVTAVLAALALGVHVEGQDAVLGLTAAAAAAHSAIAIVPWRRWMPDRRGRVLLDLWSVGLLGYVALLVIAGGGRSGLDLLLFLVVPFLALVHAGRRRRLFLAGAAGSYLGAMAVAPDPLALGGVALHGVLLAAVAVLALVLERAVRREAGARAEAARAELEHALLAEAHHRVKNSLQTVADLLLLGRPASGDGAAFDSTAERIRAIAAVHRLLADRCGRAVTAAELLDRVARAAAVDTPVALDADDVLLAPAQAQQLAVIANELIANAARHGRPPISVRFAGGDPARLEVHDAGTAGVLPADGLGLRLVRQVTEHGLHGTFVFDREPDGRARARVRFPLLSHARADR